MTTFSLTELGNKSGEVIEAPLRARRHHQQGKRKFVLLTAEDYDRLKGAGTQRAWRSDRLTADERSSVLTGLDEVASRDSGRDD